MALLMQFAVLIVCLGAVLAEAGLALKLQRRTGDTLPALYLFTVAFLASYGFFGILAPELSATLLATTPGGALPGVDTLFPLFAGPLLPASGFLLYMVMLESVRRRPGAWFSAAILVLTGITLTAHGLAIYFEAHPGLWSRWPEPDAFALAYPMYYAILVAAGLASALRHSRELRSVRSERLARLLALAQSVLLVTRIALWWTAPLHPVLWTVFLLAWFAGDLWPLLMLADRLGAGPAATPDMLARAGITPREREIVTRICAGRTNGEIADELFISLQTVKTHTYRIYRKLGVRNRVQLTNLLRGANPGSSDRPD